MFDVIRTETLTCPIHEVTYEAKTVLFGAREVTDPCPKCMEEQQAKAKDEAQAEQRAQAAQLLQRQVERRFQMSALPPRYLTRTFDNYRAETEGQQKALVVTQRYAENFDHCMETGAGMILAGRPGTGKTHLACAIANDLIQQGRTALFITVASLLRKIRETYGNREGGKTEQQVFNELRQIDLLIVDEVGVQRGTESEEHLLFEVLNERNAYYRPTILISNLNAKDMTAYVGERSMDRMREGGGKFVAFDWESYRPRVAKDQDLPTASAVDMPRMYASVSEAVMDIGNTEWAR